MKSLDKKKYLCTLSSARIMNYIKEINIKDLWGFKYLHWNNINKDINILVGINGSGKSTLLNLLWATLNSDKNTLKKYSFHSLEVRNEEEIISVSTPKGIKIENLTNKLNSVFISTFDVTPLKSSKSSPLLAELNNVIYTTGKNSNSFYDYRLKATNFPNEAELINKRIDKLYKLINRQFSKTQKTVYLDPIENKLRFKNKDTIIDLENLSSGEKQFLLIIFKVFLMDEKPYILLMDEPEISLHIDWQHKLINTIQELNLNCQIIISTHSPSIFGDGWGDKITYMEDILE